jgi:hypothetical protein
MTEEQKDDFKRTTYSAFIATVLASLVLFLVTGMTDDKKEIKKELNTKAPYSYVDQKCLEVKEDAEADKKEIIERLNSLDQKTNKILELMIEKR